MNKIKVNTIYCINLLTATTVFSFAVLYSTISLYLTEILKYSKHQSNSIVAIFIASNFLLHLFAGYLGGRWLNNKVLLFIALSSQLIGSLLLQYNCLYIGLSFFLIGCGFCITCLNCILTEHFENHDQRREKAFFLNYAALNFGSFFGFFLSGYFYSSQNFKTLFQINTCSCFVALLLFFLLRNNISSNFKRQSNILIGNAIIILIFLFVFFGFYFENTVNNLIIFASVITLAYIAVQARKSNSSDKARLYVFLLYSITAIFFWTLYFVVPMALMFFLKNNIKHSLFGFEIPPQWFMNFDTLMIVIFSPILALFFQNLNQRGWVISTTKKFSVALMAISLAYLLMYLGIKSADITGLVNLTWIILYYIIQSFGELLMAPTGYAMVGQLAPKQLQGLLMGAWMMVCGLASIFSYYVSNAMTIKNTSNPLMTNSDYAHVFGTMGFYAIIFSIFLFLLSKKIDPLINRNEVSLARVEECNLGS